MNKSFIILITMIFLHIIDDFKLQGNLANFKQKQWWIDNYPSELYKHDYFTCLILHSFSWSFMIMLPLFTVYYSRLNILHIVLFIVNILVHAIIDDVKANSLKISLTTDQLLHLCQIVVTWLIFK